MGNVYHERPTSLHSAIQHPTIKNRRGTLKQYYLENFSNFERFLFTFCGTNFFFLITSFFLFLFFFLVLTENKQVLEKKQLFLDIGRNENASLLQNKTNYVRRFIHGKYQDANSTSGKRIRTSDNGELFIDRVQESDGGRMNAEDWNMFIIT